MFGGLFPCVRKNMPHQGHLSGAAIVFALRVPHTNPFLQQGTDAQGNLDGTQS
jgi:hypothetical protein